MPMPPTKNPKARERHKKWASKPEVKVRMKEAQRRYRAKNRDKINAYDRKRRDRDRVSYNLYQKTLKYGLTAASYRVMEKSQDGKCAICALPSARLHVDHDHATGKTRGLLCGHCNLGLGQFKDSVDVLMSAINYIVRSKQNGM